TLFRSQLTPLQPQDAVAGVPDGLVVVADQEDRAGLLAQLPDARLGALLELPVTGGQRLVDHEDVVVLGGGDGEPQAGGHAGGVGAHRQGDEVALLVDAGEVDDVLVALPDLFAGHAHREPAQYDVAFAREVVHQGRVDAEQGGLAVGVDLALLGGEQAGDGPQQGRLAGAVGADQADRLAPVRDEGDPAHGVHLAHPAGRVVLAAPQDAAQRGRGAAAAAAGGVDAVDDVQPVRDDGGHA